MFKCPVKIRRPRFGNYLVEGSQRSIPNKTNDYLALSSVTSPTVKIKAFYRGIVRTALY